MKFSVIIYIPSLVSGGAERLHFNLAPALIKRGIDVTFLVHGIKNTNLGDIPPGVRLVSLNCNRTLGAFLPLVRYLRDEKPHVLVSNLGHNNIIAIWARFFSRVRTRVVVTQHNNLSAECSPKRGWQFGMLRWLYKRFLSRADGIVAVSQGVAKDLSNQTGIAIDRITVIYNPVVTPDFNSRADEKVSHPWLLDNGSPIILAVGRLVDQKDFHTLFSAFAIAAKRCDARLILLGEGALRESLESQADLLGISDRVSMPGFQTNPLAFMKQASLLVMSSQYEGFGNVLVEALACGTPVVSTDCPYGPSEILDGGTFGSLVPVANKEAMASAIIETLKKPLPSDILRQRGREFTVDRAAIQYLDLFFTLVFTLPEFTDKEYENPTLLSFDRWHYRY
jgi:glycosyltransferase involved in cell wall biosynthesis